MYIVPLIHGWISEKDKMTTEQTSHIRWRSMPQRTYAHTKFIPTVIFNCLTHVLLLMFYPLRCACGIANYGIQNGSSVRAYGEPRGRGKAKRRTDRERPCSNCGRADWMWLMCARMELNLKETSVDALFWMTVMSSAHTANTAQYPGFWSPMRLNAAGVFSICCASRWEWRR